MLRDEPWQDLGFAKRPRYGEIVQRFRPLWRVQFEKTALKQMIAVLTAAHVHAGALDATDVREVVDILVDGPQGSTQLWRLYGYASRAEAIEGLVCAIGTYVESEPQQWASILGSALNVPSVPDRRLAARLFLGTVRFTQTAEDMVPFLRSNAG